MDFASTSLPPSTYSLGNRPDNDESSDERFRLMKRALEMIRYSDERQKGLTILEETPISVMMLANTKAGVKLRAMFRSQRLGDRARALHERWLAAADEELQKRWDELAPHFLTKAQLKAVERQQKLHYDGMKIPSGGGRTPRLPSVLPAQSFAGFAGGGLLMPAVALGKENYASTSRPTPFPVVSAPPPPPPQPPRYVPPPVIPPQPVRQIPPPVILAPPPAATAARTVQPPVEDGRRRSGRQPKPKHFDDNFVQF